MIQKNVASLLLVFVLPYPCWLAVEARAVTRRNPSRLTTPPPTKPKGRQSSCWWILPAPIRSFGRWLLADEYEDLWLKDSGELVGEENAAAAYEMLASMVTAEIYGEDAVEAYKEGGGAISAALPRACIRWR